MVLLSKKIFVLLAVLLTGLYKTSLVAQATFSASITPTTMGKNETAELRLAIDNANKVERISPPDLKDFIIVSGPNQETGMESVNGVTRRYVGVTYLVRPRKKGRFVIAPVTAEADGKTLKTNRLTVTVTNDNSGGGTTGNNILPDAFYEPVIRASDRDYILKPGENVADKIDKNIFIKVDVDKRTCFVGEPVIVVYKLYTRLKSESSIVKNPSFNGFSVIDLLPPGNTYYSIEMLNGREYNVYTLRKSQLYPLQNGTIELESAEVENHVQFIKEEYLIQQQNNLGELFRDFNQTNIPPQGIHDEKVTLRSNPIFINVKALPGENKTAAYNGAVGNFTIESSVDKTSFTTDDAGKLRVIISGEGNMTMINAPDVAWPAGIESYDPGTREQLNKYAVPVSGMKVFEYPFTIAKAGNYILPAVTFTFFDVKKDSYQTLSTKPFNINVTNGTGKSTAALIKRTPNEDKRQFFNIIFNNRWLIIAPLCILVITGVFVWWRKDNRQIAYEKTVVAVNKENTPVTLAPVVDYNPLLTTEEQLGTDNPKTFYEMLNKDFRKFLADKLQLPVETINKKKISEEADKKGIPVNTCLQIQHLLDSIEWQLYTPFSEREKMQQMYNTADHIVHELNSIT